ncbi:ATP-binding protein [Streptomyces sp. NPDC059900]|uniref:ATP-binding protein n=1 Tax=Streptomyces sp. NPDC059900 TaxID=3155816 RepID=UPI00344189B4
MTEPAATPVVLREVVVRRLLAVGQAGGVTRVHVRIAAEAAGVSERTVWRWLEVARESGRVDPMPRRSGFTLDDVLWARLADLGGNVSALYRWMTSDLDGHWAAEGSLTPSLATVMRAVRRDLGEGRVLEIARPARGHVVPDCYDRAVADLALPGTVDEAGRASGRESSTGAGSNGGSDTSSRPELLAGVRLYAPGAHLVSTRQLAEATKALAHTVAARGVLCLYGDPGYGKSVTVYQALRLLPRRVPVHRAVIAVKPALPQLRAALLTAFGLPAQSLTNRTEAADRALIDALKSPGVLVIDDVQRIAAAELDYLRLLIDAPTTRASLVLCGAGAERSLNRAPALASRVLTWQHMPRLEASQLPAVLRLFHPLWDTALDEDLLHADETCARGNFRTWAKITSHLYAIRDRHPERPVDRQLVTWACGRLGPHP